MALTRTLKKAASRVGNYYKKGWSEFGKNTKELIENPKKAVGEYMSSGKAKEDVGDMALGMTGVVGQKYKVVKEYARAGKLPNSSMEIFFSNKAEALKKLKDKFASTALFKKDGKKWVQIQK